MEPGLIDQGVELMVFGMGTVVVFLTLLVLSTMLMSAIMQRLVSSPAPEPAAAAPAELTDSTLLAVIAAAIHQHRTRR